MSRTHDLLDGLLLACRRGEEPLAVAALQEDDSYGPGGVLAVVVEEEVLVEAEPAEEPLGAVGTALVQVAGVAAVVPKTKE